MAATHGTSAFGGTELAAVILALACHQLRDLARGAAPSGSLTGRYDRLAVADAHAERSGGIARVVLGPDWDAASGSAELRSIWQALNDDADVNGVIVIARSAGCDGQPSAASSDDQAGVGPKTNGLIKPFGLGISGTARNEVLQLAAEADIVLATRDATFADTSTRQGRFPIHAFALRRVLPGAEALRIGLLADDAPMSSERALELELVEAIVSDEELEAELLRRVKILGPH